MAIPFLMILLRAILPAWLKYSSFQKGPSSLHEALVCHRTG